MAQLSGKIIQVFPLVSGETEKGEWCRGGFVVQTMETPSVTVAFSLFGEKRVKMLEGLKVGDTVIVEYRPESREYAGKWFTDLQCYRLMYAQNSYEKGTVEKD